MSKKLLFILAPVLLIAVGLIVFSLSKGGKTPMPAGATKPKNLVYWRVFDNDSDFSDITGAWRSMHPNISIEYRKLTYEEYEQALLEAWAKGEGPDIFSIQNSWTGKYRDFISPLPENTGMAYYSEVKTLGVKKEQKIEYKETPSLKLYELQNNFVDVVYKDAVINDQVYGLPLALDTLALFYNKDLLNQAKIATPPKTYDEFLSDVTKMTVLDKDNNVVQAGAALGTTNNIPRAIDILSLFMFQAGAEMTNASGGSVRFLNPSPSDPTITPGVQALEFYTQFADKNKESYTWNEDQPNALEQFAKGKLGFFFGYSYQIPLIEQQSQGQIRYGITAVPQISQEVNMANYWLETVSKQSPYANEAWDFIQFAAKAENVTSYLTKVKKPTALKALIDQQASQDYVLEPFIRQVFSAKSWYHGKKPSIMEGYLADAVEDVSKNKLKAEEALQLAQNLIQQTY